MDPHFLSDAFSADVSGVKLIELVVRASTGGTTPLPVTWAEAALLAR